jgi:predicted Zn-dependent protease
VSSSTSKVRRLALALVVATGLAQAAKEIRPGWNLFSPEQDVQLGQEGVKEIEKEVQVVDDKQLTNYIADIGKRLAANSQAPDYPYSFKVVADDSINAFALPGGPIYVHTGLITAADNEAQVAGVLAHEVGHVALRHSTHQISKARAWQIPLALAAGALEKSGGLLGTLGQMGIGFGANSLFMKYSRDAEKDADIVGARMMARTGYDPVEMARFFEKLQSAGG